MNMTDMLAPYRKKEKKVINDAWYSNTKSTLQLIIFANLNLNLNLWHLYSALGNVAKHFLMHLTVSRNLYQIN